MKAIIKGFDYRFKDTRDASGYEPYTDFRLFQGSSTYDTRQMGRLIDELISEAESLGIDALTPGEKARMMSEW